MHIPKGFVGLLSKDDLKDMYHNCVATHKRASRNHFNVVLKGSAFKNFACYSKDLDFC